MVFGEMLGALIRGTVGLDTVGAHQQEALHSGCNRRIHHAARGLVLQRVVGNAAVREFAQDANVVNDGVAVFDNLPDRFGIVDIAADDFTFVGMFDPGLARPRASRSRPWAT